MENYYRILGVNQDASADEIKKSYHNLAFKYHPDRNPGDKKAEEDFKQVSEAYQVLIDDHMRAKHDEELRQEQERKKRKKEKDAHREANRRTTQSQPPEIPSIDWGKVAVAATVCTIVVIGVVLLRR